MVDVVAGQESVELSVTSQLIEDYLNASEHVPLALGGPKTLAALGDGLIAVDGRKLFYFRRNGTSKTGWSSTEVPVEPPQTAVDPGIVSILGFETSGAWGTALNVLCFYKASEGFAVAWRYATSDLTRWTTPRLSVGAASLISQVSSLDVFEAGGDIGAIVYGVTAQPTTPFRNVSRLFNIYIDNYRTKDGPVWLAGSQREVSDFGCGVNARPRFLFMASIPTTPRRAIGAMWWDTAAPLQQGTKVTWGRANFGYGGFAGDLPQTLNRIWTTETALRRVEANAVGDRTKESWVIYTVSAENLLRYVALPRDGQAIDQYPLRTAVDDVAVLTRRDGGVSLFATDPAGRLEVLRTVERDPVWARLGNVATALAVPAHPVSVLEVFFGSVSEKNPKAYDLYRLSQDQNGGLWIEDRIGDVEETGPGVEQGTVPPQSISSVAIQISAVVGTGTPAGRARIRINSDQWAFLIVDDLGYWVGPGKEAAFDTDQHGSVTALQRATSLKFAGLSIDATVYGSTMSPPQPNDPATPTRYVRGDHVQPPADGSRQWRPDPPTTTVAKRLASKDPSFDLGTKLADQKGKLFPSDSKPEDVSNLTVMLNTIGLFMLTQQGDPQHVRAAWTFSAEPQGFSCAPLPFPEGESLGGFFSDVWGDITHLAKRVETTVSSWTVQVEDAALRVAVVIDGITRKIEAKTLQEAGDLVETIFVSIAKAVKSVVKFIEEVVAFLRMLFDWGDIKRTHRVFRRLFEFGLAYAQVEDEDVKKTVLGKLQEVEQRIEGDIDSLIARFKDSDATPTTIMRGHMGVDLAGQKERSDIHNHRSRLTYIHSKSQKRLSTSPIVANRTGGHVERFMHPARGWSDGNKKSSDSFIDDLKKIDADKLLSSTVILMLDIGKDILVSVMRGVERVISIVFDLAADAMKEVGSVVMHHIEIPLVTWIYENFIAPGSKMDILDVFCLIMAVPATILSKLSNGGNAPFAGVEDIIDQVFSRDGRLDLAPLGGSLASDEAMGMSPAQIILMGMGLAGASAVAINSIFSTYVDYETIGNLAAGRTEVPSTPLAKVRDWTVFLSEAIGALLSMPLSTWMNWKGHREIVAIFQTVVWGLGAVMVIIDGLVLVFGGKLLREEDAAGAVIDGLLGLVILGCALAYLILALGEEGHDQQTDWDLANAMFANATRPLRIVMAGAWKQDANEPDGPIVVKVIQALVLGGDVITAIGSVVTQIGAAIADNTAVESLPSTS